MSSIPTSKMWPGVIMLVMGAVVVTVLKLAQMAG